MWMAIGLPWCSAEGQIHIHEGILLLYFSLHNNFSTMDAHWDDMNFSCLLWRKKIYRFLGLKVKVVLLERHSDTKPGM
jgi:hypothetical protein